MGHESGTDRVEPVDHLRIVAVDVGQQIDPMVLDLIGQVRIENGDAERAAQLARQIDETRGLLRVFGVEGAVGDVVDRREQEAEPEPADHERRARV